MEKGFHKNNVTHFNDSKNLHNNIYKHECCKRPHQNDIKNALDHMYFK